MRRLVSALVLALVGLGLALFIGHKAKRPTVGQAYRTSVLMRDASRLPLGSQVVIAGVRVGEIDALTIEGDLARVSMRLRDDVVLWADASAMKKASSLLGDNYIELSPGGPDVGQAPTVRRLASGDPIGFVVEGASADRTLRAIDSNLPRVDRGLASAREMVAGARAWSAGRLTEWVADGEAYLAAGSIESALATADRGAAGLERFTERAAEATEGLDRLLFGKLDAWNRDLVRMRDGMRDARGELAQALGDVRANLDEVDPILARASSTMAALGDRAPPAERDTVARLIHDDDLADTLDDLAADGADASAGLDRLRSFIGFRTEFNLRAEPRFYVIAELAARRDTFYRIELSKDGLGGTPELTLTDGPGTGSFTQRGFIQEGLRFTAQWGKRLGPVAVRLGLKESTFGVGADLNLLDGRLRLEGDVLDATFGDAPRVKLGAAFELFRSIYVLGGIDDALNAPSELPVAAWPDDVDVPVYFQQVPTGRDVFAGVMLRFTDADLTRLLLIYGALVAGLM
ncbi:MAG: MlaD family protein [Kofleriaceae bacterium]